ncbi:hypothetical protein SNE40_020043 [Patella caerulea]|uniref:Tryptophan--tRNA ligase, mitochondrial n=1 Tax=Patella caerulea TaxID=87958 RepID=A0AAN8J4J8_PATCE
MCSSSWQNFGQTILFRRGGLFFKRYFRPLSCPTLLSSTVERKEKYAICPPQVFSGIQPTGIPHIGNYVGAIRNWLKLQKKYQRVILSIVDLHSITTPQNPERLRENIFDMTACLIACGVDLQRCILFQQSSVSQHAELAWILGCMCTLPRLQQLPQFKQKSDKLKDVGVGLFTYPILQAADILLYKSTLIPVGKDQLQHIELARHLARTFNRTTEVLFPNPIEMIGHIPKIQSLRNPANKMSKSEENTLGRIDLTDSPDNIREKVKKAKTDFTSRVTYDPDNRPGVANLIKIHEALTGDTPEDICEDALLLDTARYKLKLAEIIIEKLKPIRENYIQLKSDRGYLKTVLEAGQLKAIQIAEATFSEVKKAIGLT